MGPLCLMAAALIAAEDATIHMVRVLYYLGANRVENYLYRGICSFLNKARLFSLGLRFKLISHIIEHIYVGTNEL